ncbi:MAG: beta-lactamase family protein [Gudongella sp.]|nr:beta-lactamase family protein [Gudongella sp.]
MVKVGVKGRTTVVVLVIMLGTLSGCLWRGEIHDGINDRLDGYLSSFNEANGEKRINGTIIITNGGRIVATKSCGKSDFRNGTDFTENTKTMLGSTTKMFTAIAVMQLCQEGKLSLQDKVSEYIPDQYRGDEITIEYLLMHSSGVIRDLTDTGAIGPFESIGFEELVEKIGDRSLLFDPGISMKYSNAGYQLLGAVIESASGMSYGDYIESNIFEPAGMRSSGVVDRREEVEGLAVGYEFDGVGFVEKEFYSMSHAYGSGNIYSTAHDMYLFDSALSAGKLLGDESINAMIGEGVEPLYNYGYGCYVGELHDSFWYGHPGNLNSGYFSMYVRFPDEDIGVIVLLNTTWEYNNGIMLDICTIALGLE